jgi:hypothetical protein
MAFCTVVEWDGDLAADRYDALTGSAAAALPGGCLSRIVGRGGSGARLIEVWRSDEDARRYNEQNAEAVSELRLPPPARVAAFQTTVFRTAE